MVMMFLMAECQVPDDATVYGTSSGSHCPSEANLIRPIHTKNHKMLSKQEKASIWLSSLLNSSAAAAAAAKSNNAGSQFGLEDAGRPTESTKEIAKLGCQHRYSSDRTKESKDSVQDTRASSRSVSYDDAKYVYRAGYAVLS